MTAWRPWICFAGSIGISVLLDLMLQKLTDIGVCEVIRRESSVPIVMLTNPGL